MRNKLYLLGLILLCSISSMQAQFNSLKLPLAFKAVCNYFEIKGLGIARSDVMMIENLLNKRFNLKLNIPSDTAFAEKSATFTHCYFKLYGIYFRNQTAIFEADSAQVMHILQSQIRKLDIKTAWSMYANVYPITDTFLHILCTPSQDPYTITHLAFQIYNIQENANLTAEQTTLLKEAKARLVNQMEQIQNDTTLMQYATDIRIEAMAMLSYMGYKNKISPQAIEFLLHSQQDNGAWKASETDMQTNEHTSVLALWFLCDYLMRTE